MTAPTDHSYKYVNTAEEHWTECTVCHAVTNKKSHKFAEWKTTVKPGYTFTGVKQRVCRVCEYAIEETLPMLTKPEDKFVVIIPNYSKGTPESGGKPTVIVPTTPTTPDTPTTPVTPTTPDTPKQDSTSSEDVNTVTKELLSKGDKSVPTLPVLAPTADGNIFEGWKDKETGNIVKSGDKLTGNIELEPVFKDCGEDNHKDEDNDNACDECGHILVKQTPETDNTPETTPDETETTTKAPDDEQTSEASGTEAQKSPENGSDSTGIDGDKDSNGIIAIIISALAAVIAAVIAIITVILSKKKKKSKEEPKE